MVLVGGEEMNDKKKFGYDVKCEGYRKKKRSDGLEADNCLGGPDDFRRPV